MEFQEHELENDGDKQTILQIAHGVSLNDEGQERRPIEGVGKFNVDGRVDSDSNERGLHDHESPQGTSGDRVKTKEEKVTPTDCDLETLPAEPGSFRFDKSPDSDSEHSSQPVNIKMSLGISKPGDGLSSNDSSCLNSPLLLNFNGITLDSISASNININVLVREFETLKENYQNLQNDYKTSLEREKELCDRLQEYGGQGDESCNSLMSINNELRTELDNVLAELRTLRSENKR